MPEHLQGVLYTAAVVPESMGGSGEPGANPGGLFAVGYAACLRSVLLPVATGQRLDASGSRITSRAGSGSA